MRLNLEIFTIVKVTMWNILHISVYKSLWTMCTICTIVYIYPVYLCLCRLPLSITPLTVYSRHYKLNWKLWKQIYSGYQFWILSMEINNSFFSFCIWKLFIKLLIIISFYQYVGLICLWIENNSTYWSASQEQLKILI